MRSVYLFLVALLLVSCDGNPVDDFRTSTEYLEFMAAVEGEPGIIGTLDWVPNSDGEKHAKVSSATAFLASPAPDGLGAGATGLLVVKPGDRDQQFILTARHFIYDLASGQQKSPVMLVRFNARPPVVAKVDLRELPRFMDEKEKFRDFILIPIESVKVEPIDFPMEAVNVSQIINNKENLNSTSVIFRNKKMFAFYQTGFEIFDRTYGSYALDYSSNIDAVDGVSGSPVFYYDNDEVVLIGIVTRASKSIECKTYKDIICQNYITVFDNG